MPEEDLELAEFIALLISKKINNLSKRKFLLQIGSQSGSVMA